MSQCKSCGKKIVWLKTRRGRSIPVDAETASGGDQLFDYRKHMSHFATCPDANLFRTKEVAQ